MSAILDPGLHNVVTTLRREGLAAMVGPHVNPDLAIVARQGAGHGDYRYFVSAWPGDPPDRVKFSLNYVEHLRAIVAKDDAPLRDDGPILFQIEDIPVDVPSVSWEARTGWRNIRLIPDLYYFMGSGYEGFEPGGGRWEDRRPSLVWRGAGTGAFSQTLETLDDLPRYRMCKVASQLGARADVGLTQAAQALTPEDDERIVERLASEGLLKPFVPMTEMARHRYILDIDGNSNSWNFMQKLRLGCCVLRVESVWRQWFSDRLVAWEHYVPVATDLSDLIERAEWCFANPAECSAIAARGTKFAVDMRFADEMKQAAWTAFGATDGQVQDVR